MMSKVHVFQNWLFSVIVVLLCVISFSVQSEGASSYSFDIQAKLAQLLPSSGGDVTNGASQALKYFKYMFIGAPPEYIPSSECLDHVTDFLQGILSHKEWAMKMLDAMGKPETGILGGNFKWLGSYDECVAVQAAFNESGEITYPWKGQYCTAIFKLENLAKEMGMAYQSSPSGPPQLSVGVCMPNGCSNQDVSILLYKLLDILQLNSTLYSPNGYCQKDSIDLDTKAFVALAISSVILFLMATATIYDVILQHVLLKQTKDLPKYANGSGGVYIMTTGADLVKSNGQAKVNGDKILNGDVSNEKNSETAISEQEQINNSPGTFGKVLLAFSVYTNGSKILNTNQPKGTLTAVNGIRFISMTWVILGHVFGFHLSGSSNVGDYFSEASKKIEFQAILNATFSVDTFFVLSGLLVSYLSLKEMKKRKGAKNFQWGLFYFHRFWRLTPPYMLFMMVYVCLSRYLYNGPQWSQEGLTTEKCVDYWWRNLLYINNLFPVEDMCFSWGWYLANDMQFYILSPLMLLPLYYSAVWGTLSCFALLTVCCVSSGLISYRDHLVANMVFDQPEGKSFNNLYDKPWTRIGPYVVGFFAGYILYRTNCKIRMPKIASLLGWLTASAIALTVIYGLYDESGTPLYLSHDLASLYNATSRTAWAVAVCWVIIACATGHGGFVNTFLSWKAIIPLSRLTYCAYLVHPVVIYFYMMASRKILYFSTMQAIYLFCGHLCISYALAFVVSLAFESPMMGLERVLLGRGKNS